MYKISVPIMNQNLKRAGRDRTLAELRRMNAERVFLALDTYETDPAARAACMEELTDNCRFFQQNGFEVGAWIWTFWIKNNTTYTNMRGINGEEFEEFVCPTDEAFVRFSCDYIADIARCGVDIIQFDDDFRYSFHGSSPACLCDNHIAMINRMTGKESTREEIAQHVVSGKKNALRDAYLQANGDAFRAFAKQVRKSVDSVNPNIRISLCACLSSWDIDGTNAQELSGILAGNTQPLLRLIGAPYWAVEQNWGNRLQDVIELERMESAWTRNESIEIMAEGDAYPRPRTCCPASYLEGFDTAIRASGCTDGILKYGIDYWSNADYETGYATMHERNRDIYSAIDRAFANKHACGVRVYESMQKVADMVVPTAVNDSINVEYTFFSKAARTLAYNSVPTVYEGDGVCGIVFDENARNLPLSALKNGLILDIAAAEILTERGVDVGVAHIGKRVNGFCEHFIDTNNYILINGTPSCELTLKSGAEVLSDTETASGKYPLSYRYQNADGDRFLVLNFNTRSDRESALKNYERSRQYAEQIPWLNGKTLPAHVYGSPALYLQCKKGEDSMAVGLWNFFADPVFTPTVLLDEAYRSVRPINCTAQIDGNRVTLSDIPAFGFAGFEVLK